MLSVHPQNFANLLWKNQVPFFYEWRTGWQNHQTKIIFETNRQMIGVSYTSCSIVLELNSHLIHHLIFPLCRHYTITITTRNGGAFIRVVKLSGTRCYKENVRSPVSSHCDTNIGWGYFWVKVNDWECNPYPVSAGISPLRMPAQSHTCTLMPPLHGHALASRGWILCQREGILISLGSLVWSMGGGDWNGEERDNLGWVGPGPGPGGSTGQILTPFLANQPLTQICLWNCARCGWGMIGGMRNNIPLLPIALQPVPPLCWIQCRQLGVPVQCNWELGCPAPKPSFPEKSLAPAFASFLQMQILKHAWLRTFSLSAFHFTPHHTDISQSSPLEMPPSWRDQNHATWTWIIHAVFMWDKLCPSKIISDVTVRNTICSQFVETNL